MENIKHTLLETAARGELLTVQKLGYLFEITKAQPRIAREIRATSHQLVASVDFSSFTSMPFRDRILTLADLVISQRELCQYCRTTTYLSWIGWEEGRYDCKVFPWLLRYSLEQLGEAGKSRILVPYHHAHGAIGTHLRTKVERLSPEAEGPLTISFILGEEEQFKTVSEQQPLGVTFYELPFADDNLNILFLDLIFVLKEAVRTQVNSTQPELRKQLRSLIKEIVKEIHTRFDHILGEEQKDLTNWMYYL